MTRCCHHKTNSNGPNASATVAAQWIPFLYPGYTYFKEGAYFIQRDYNQSNLIEVSPDGTLRNKSHKVTYTLEIKCPFPQEWKLPMMYEVPQLLFVRYFLHWLHATAKHLLFMYYSKKSMTILNVRFDAELWSSVKEDAGLVFPKVNPTVPTRLSDAAKNSLQEYILPFLLLLHSLSESFPLLEIRFKKKYASLLVQCR